MSDNKTPGIDEKYLTREEAKQLFAPMLLALMKLINASTVSMRGDSDTVKKLSADADVEIRTIIARLAAFGLVADE